MHAAVMAAAHPTCQLANQKCCQQNSAMLSQAVTRCGPRRHASSLALSQMASDHFRLRVAAIA